MMWQFFQISYYYYYLNQVQNLPFLFPLGRLFQFSSFKTQLFTTTKTKRDFRGMISYKIRPPVSSDFMQTTMTKRQRWVRASKLGFGLVFSLYLDQTNGEIFSLFYVATINEFYSVSEELQVGFFSSYLPPSEFKILL